MPYDVTPSHESAAEQEGIMGWIVPQGYRDLIRKKKKKKKLVQQSCTPKRRTEPSKNTAALLRNYFQQSKLTTQH